MLEQNRTDVSERINVNKTNQSLGCFIYNCLYFLKANFIFQLKACDGCHDLVQKFSASKCFQKTLNDF